MLTFGEGTLGVERLEEIMLFRFRVRSADGKESTSETVARRKAKPGEPEGAEEAALPDEVPVEVMLANPRWSDESFDHGDHATMLVDAPGADGTIVRFHVEQRHGEEWKPYGEAVEAKVEKGVAEALLQLHHPAPDEHALGASDLRFRCEAEKSKVVSTDKPAATADPITLYRFRVKAKDGRQAYSAVFASRSLLKAHLAGPGDDKSDEKKKEEMLANPRWSDGSFGHGEHAAMLVDAPGLDGRTIRFLVEHKNGETWSDYDQLEAKVANGVAEAQLQLHHPAPGEEEASAADLRFACEVI